MSTTTESTVTDEHYLRDAPINRAIAHLSVPLMFAMIAGVIYGVVNAFFIGQLHDTNMLAALTYSLPVFIITMTVGSVYGAGGAAYIGRLLGGGDRERIKHVSATVLYGALLTGALVGGIGLLLLHPIVFVIGARNAAASPTALYVAMLFAFLPAFAANFALEQLVRSTGATRQTMYGLFVNTGVNLILDYTLILQLHLGVLGAGIAMGVASVASAIYYLGYLHLRQPVMGFAPRLVRVDRPMVREVLGVGSSELFQSLFLLVSGTVLINIATIYGPDLVASFGLGMRVSQLPEALTQGVSLGLLPLFAYTSGSGQQARLHAALRASLLWIAAIVVIFSGGVFLLRNQVFMLFSNDAGVLHYGTIVLSAFLASSLFNGFTALLMAYFQGTGRAKAATILGIVMGAAFLPALLGGAALFGANGVIWALTVGEAAAFVTGLILFLRRPHVQPATPTQQDVALAQPNPSIELAGSTFV